EYQLPGYADDLSTATFCLFNEDHTIGNTLRYILMKNGNVEFCGYSIPHPSEPKVHLRIQMYDNLSAIDALYKGLDDLENRLQITQRSDPSNKKPKKEAILDLSRFVDQSLRLKFQGGREATGILKGYDQLMNLVMDDVVEILQDGSSRTLGLVVLRGPAITVINPSDGSEEIANPFTQE
ncbi:hypothetical protein E3Q01_01333, partial [Wallemia mellicola]